MAESPTQRTISFNVPGQPVAKARARTGKGFSYTPAKTVHYEEWVKLCAMQKLNGQDPFEGPVSMELEIWQQIPKSWSKKRQLEARQAIIRPATKPDIDNVLKTICDACNGLVFVDDRQIVDLRVTKRYCGTPQVIVRVKDAQNSEM